MAPALPQLVVALDNCTPEAAKQLVAELDEAGVRWFKVGLELYTQTGPAFVRELKNSGKKVFLDLKLHDIPNTVSKSVTAAAETGADLLTVHCSGGPAMLEAAQQAAAASATGLQLVGVTVLTSLDGDDFAGVSRAWGARDHVEPPRGAVALSLASLAARAGLSGIVCSASDLHDGQLRRLAWQHAPIFITPGIRQSEPGAARARPDDQKSVATVEQAITAGSTHLVVGRPINGQPAGSRGAAARNFLRKIQETHAVQAHS